MNLVLSKRRSSPLPDSNQLVAGLPEFVIPGESHLFVIAPHPDDEILGLGGVFPRLDSAGVRLTVLALTDGEAMNPLADPNQRRRLAAVRFLERRMAMNALGVQQVSIYRFRFPDGGLEQFEDEVELRIAKMLSFQSSGAREKSIIFAPWRHDLHPDHEAAGRAGAKAALAAGCQFVEMPIWAWYHIWELDQRLPLHRAAIIPLTEFDRLAKEKALATFESQTLPLGSGFPVLPNDFMADFDRGFELVLT